MKKLCLLVCCIVIYGPVFGQNFNYSTSTSTASYTALVGVDMFNGAIWDADQKKVPIGFSFVFNGTSYDSLIVHTDGLVSFDEAFTNVAAAFYSDLSCKVMPDTSGSSSYPTNAEVSISKVIQLTDGLPGSRILKLEYHNIGVYEGSETDYVSFQIWIYESNNKIEFRYGNQNISDPSSAFEGNDGPSIGLMNMNANGVGIQNIGSGSAPSFQMTPAGELHYSTGVPTQNTVYIFTPN